jgi:hypothetical protein
VERLCPSSLRRPASSVHSLQTVGHPSSVMKASVSRNRSWSLICSGNRHLAVQWKLCLAMTLTRSPSQSAIWPE